ncbi:NAD(P)H-dependent oxidoreductase [Bradyrhizobium sp. 132]|uniref:NAD(P)H-dependent oxidoreductase n=1 Tax=unclassified Bradyrhizobium TaxID=2631580 RepID=UPI003211CEE7
MSRSEELIQELESADCVVIATPMHNFTVPAALKAWIDHVVRVRRTFDVTAQGKVGALKTGRSLSQCPRTGDFPASARISPIFSRHILKLSSAASGCMI